MANRSELSDLIGAAAIVLLHREIREHGQVKLSTEDFTLAEAAEDLGQAIQLSTNVDGDVILTHTQHDVARQVV